MKHIVLYLFVLFAINIFAQNKHEDGPFKEYYKNGTLKTEGTYKSDEKIGRWQYYYDNGQLEKEDVFLPNGGWSGFSRTYTLAGVLKSETKTDPKEYGSYIEKEFFSDGSVQREYKLKYVNEKKYLTRKGPYKEYYANGNIKVECMLDQGNIEGVWKHYYPTTELEWEVNYTNNYKQGIYKQYYTDGTVQIEGTTDLDLKNGEELRFDAVGKSIQKLKYKKGVLKNTSKNADVIITNIPDGVLEKVPVYPGCETELGNMARRKCMSVEISKFVADKFNTTFAGDTNLKGAQKIYVIFKVDETGRVIDIRSRAEHKAFEAEAIRVLALLPKMTPGYVYGKPVKVPYTLPIVFKI
ncbi:TonB family protein [Formosa agariphila KMM 3901]|uniref:TonB family protein n=1 Tax=Formosa agariphila (strain DSM 15362 / KCTC 12365 / LMG 23005 / KMM 3901 / M-2Alg 35-1) TaxID=1347342 RepID=T2KHS3_FORAG|nr:energy transducer TonB [Formosa agariphila]CDF77976.1 TonB family protein [Formosa agariphila KMM 3901]